MAARNLHEAVEKNEKTVRKVSTKKQRTKKSQEEAGLDEVTEGFPPYEGSDFEYDEALDDFDPADYVVDETQKTSSGDEEEAEESHSDEESDSGEGSGSAEEESDSAEASTGSSNSEYEDDGVFEEDPEQILANSDKLDEPVEDSSEDDEALYDMMYQAC